MTHSNTPLTLLILAGGLGSRYAGSKQIDGIGPNGEFLLEYAIYDALNVGFNKIVLVVNSEVEKTLSDRLHKQFHTSELVLLAQEKIKPERIKPWGTGHAVLSAKHAINESFMIINADDYYGRSTFQNGVTQLLEGTISDRKMGLIAFQLSNTLSDFGGVSRGICQVNDEGNLTSVKEHEGIENKNGTIHSLQSGEASLDGSVPVSMNCWLLAPCIFDHLQKGFDDFFSENKNSGSKEYYLPTAIQQLIDTEQVDFRLTYSNEQWFGLTYANDKQLAKEKIKKAINDDVYPKSLANG